MLRQSIRSSKSLALSFALVLTAAGVAGCGGESGTQDESPVDSAVQGIRVTAGTIADLAPGDVYKLDMTRENVVYILDYSDSSGGAIDYSRIQLASDAGSTIPLETQMKAVQEGDYGNYPTPNLLAASDSRFSIASDPAHFEVLDDAGMAQLKQNGYFFEESALKAPTAAPQSTGDDCIHAYCVICLNNATGEVMTGSSDWSQPFTCYHEEHVWCD